MKNLLVVARENLIYIILGVIFLNMLILDYFIFATRPKQIVQNISVGATQTETTGTASAGQAQVVQGAPQQVMVADVCPNTCMTAIKTATSSLKLTQNVVNNNTTTQQVSSGASEYFVPFGAASGTSQGSYTTLPALQAYVNMSNYTNVESVVFEISLSGNGITSAQLYNATDGYVIPNSQVSTPGGSPQFLISSPLTLPAGNKLYQVQIQTQLSSPATVDQARLHITLN